MFSKFGLINEDIINTNEWFKNDLDTLTNWFITKNIKKKFDDNDFRNKKFDEYFLSYKIYQELIL